MLNRNLALVADTKKITPSQLTTVAAALQKQATRDFGPALGYPGQRERFCQARGRSDGLLASHRAATILTRPAQQEFMRTRTDSPLLLFEFSDTWSLTASHETLEMLADPFGNRLVAGKSPKPGQGRVNFLVEVCDPCEDQQFAYTVNGVTVSDFYTPHFFDPVAESNCTLQLHRRPQRAAIRSCAAVT